jgi:DNA-binding transcriptional MerR regulator
VPAKPRDRSRHRDLLKIGELARRAGVGRGTIQHYLREGLLPRPVKTYRNMAYYDAACIDRIHAIKELQNKRHLPLGVIRKLLGSQKNEGEMARALIETQKAALEALTLPTPPGRMTPAAAARAFGLSQSVIDELERLGLVTARVDDGEQTLAGADLEVVAAIANLVRHGFQEELGFRVEDLVIYRRAMEQLLQDEVQTFLRVAARADMAGRRSELARAAVDAATMLVVAVRRKLIADLVSSPGPQLVDALAGAGPRKRPAPRRRGRPAGAAK